MEICLGQQIKHIAAQWKYFKICSTRTLLIITLIVNPTVLIKFEKF